MFKRRAQSLVLRTSSTRSMHKLHAIALALFAICTFSLSVGAQLNDPLEGLGIRPLRTLGWQGAQRPKSDNLAPAAAFTPGDIVVCRFGDGVASLNSNAATVFLDEYTPAGSLVQSILMPTTTSVPNKRLTASRSATTEGLITRSADGRYLIVPGYDAAVSTGSISTSTSALVNRVIGRIDASGTIDTSTALTDAISGGNPRGATSSTGTDFYLSGTSAAGGIRYATLGANTS